MGYMNSSDWLDVKERAALEEHCRLLRECPIPCHELPGNMGLFMNRRVMSRFLFFDEMYRQCLRVPGVAIEFGVRWGQGLLWLGMLKRLYEPWNDERRIIGFDSFGGFCEVSDEDGDDRSICPGYYGVTDEYEKYLRWLLKSREASGDVGVIEVIAGDATKTFPGFLRENPELIAGLVFFDFAVFKPTKECLEAVRPRLVKGSVIGFGGVNMHVTPGETLGVMEVLGLNSCRLVKTRAAVPFTYMVFE